MKPQPSTFSKTRYDLIRDCGLFRWSRHEVLNLGMDAGLVKGEWLAVGASLIDANFWALA